MVSLENMAKRLLSVNHTTRQIIVISANIYKSFKVSIGTIMKNPKILKLITDHLRTKKVFNHAVKKMSFVIRYVPDQYKTQ